MRPHAHIAILISWWVFGRVGGRGHGLVFGQIDSNGQSHVGGGAYSGSRVGLPRSCTIGAVRAWAQTDRPQNKERRKGGRLERSRSRPRGNGVTRLHPARARRVGTTLAQAWTLPAGRLSEGDVHVPVGVDSARRETEGQSGLQGLVPEQQGMCMA